MIGAILGDMIGCPYEFGYQAKSKEFPLFVGGSHFTDDSVMTLAVARAFLDAGPEADGETVRRHMVESMQDLGRRYPYAGYGGMFSRWLITPQPRPYGSFGNGSAMRVSSAGWLFGDLERTLEAARWSAEVTHDHPEGIRGAQAVAGAVFLARTGHSKEEIRRFATERMGYDLNFTCAEIRPSYTFDVSCQGTVPPAMAAFLEGEDFEDVIRTAVSLGGDCDTLTCIAGAMGEAFYGVPEPLQAECRKRLPEDLQAILDRFLAALPA